MGDVIIAQAGDVLGSSRSSTRVPALAGYSAKPQAPSYPRQRNIGIRP